MHATLVSKEIGYKAIYVLEAGHRLMQFLHDSHVTSTQFAFKRLKRQDHDVDPIETIKLNSDKEKNIWLWDMLHTLYVYYDMRYNQINVFSKVIIEMYEWHKNDNMNVKWYILTLLFLNLWSLIDVNMNYFIIDIMTNKWHLKNLESGIKSVPEHIRFDWQLDFNIVCSCLYKFI